MVEAAGLSQASIGLIGGPALRDVAGVGLGSILVYLHCPAPHHDTPPDGQGRRRGEGGEGQQECSDGSGSGGLHGRDCMAGRSAGAAGQGGLLT